jgi:hypothetical protein
MFSRSGARQRNIQQARGGRTWLTALFIVGTLEALQERKIGVCGHAHLGLGGVPLVPPTA